MVYKQVTQCRACGSKELKKYLDLGPTPLVNQLSPNQNDKPSKYPLEVLFCAECSLSQLSIVVDPEVLYKNDYPYHSSVSNTFKKHCRSLGESLLQLSKKDKPTVLDIACNDGCLLKEFKELGFIVNGVDPAKNLLPALEEYIPTVCAFWTEETADLFSYNMDFITAQNVFAHVDNIHDFLRGVKKALNKDGIFVIEVPYVLDMLIQGSFDTIYHEHLSYFTFKAIKNVLESEGLHVFNVERPTIHGGSLRVYSSKCTYNVSTEVERLMDFERMYGLHSIGEYERFQATCNETKEDINRFFQNIMFKRVFAYGASAKGVVLMNYCGIDKGKIELIVDDTKEKQGKYSPAGIPIATPDMLKSIKPDFIFITAWNFFEEIYQKTKDLGCSYIVPLPQMRVLP